MANILYARRGTDASLRSYSRGLDSYSRAYTMSSKANMARVDRPSRIDGRPGSRFHVGDLVYFQGRGPYFIAMVLGGGKYMLCGHNGDMGEGGNVDEIHLIAA